MTLPITFLSDYGYADPFAGVCRAVMARIAPDAQITDLSHGVPRQDVRRGAIQLATAIPYAAPGVTVAVVDPGVGSARLPVALCTRDEGRLLVGPDNGLLAPGAERFGGVVEAADLSDSDFLLDPVSATFHGRDIFAPVAAHLAAGAALGDAGRLIDPTSLAPLDLPQPTIADGRLTAHVLLVDTFGNAILDASAADLESSGLAGPGALTVLAGARERIVPVGSTFSDVAPRELILYFNAGAALSLGVNLGSAAEELGLGPDDEITITGPG